jgi:hypothetical protein
VLQYQQGRAIDISLESAEGMYRDISVCDKKRVKEPNTSGRLSLSPRQHDGIQTRPRIW